MPIYSRRQSQWSSNPGSLFPTRRCRRRRYDLEVLESRTLLSYTFDWTNINTVTVNESGGTDSFTVVNNGSGLLGYSINGGAFSTNWGTPGQTVAASTATTVTIRIAGDHSWLNLGDAAFPSAASANLATFVVSEPSADTANTVLIDDSTSTAASPYTIDTSTGPNYAITGPGINFQEPNGTSGGGITLKGSSGGDTYDVLSTYTGEPVTIDGGPVAYVANVTGLGIATGTLDLTGGSSNTLNYNAGGLTPTITAGTLPGEVRITISVRESSTQ